MEEPEMTRRKRVLVVDDNPVNLEIIDEALSDQFDLIFAATGLEALQMAEKFKPRVVLLDLMLPDIDGYDVCDKLRRMPNMFDTRIIMVTARAMPSEHARGLNVGADAYITKPFEPAELLNAICGLEDATPALEKRFERTGSSVLLVEFAE
jgi:putative two-component system response regulator